MSARMASRTWQAWQGWLAQRSAREQTLLRVAAGLALAGSVWTLGCAPALSVLSHSAAQQTRLNQQAAQMQAWQQEAQTLQARNALPRQEALQALQTLVQALGPKARLNLQDTQAVLTLQDLDATRLAQLLTQLRGAAQTGVREAQLQRSNAGGWSGALVLNLPQRNPSP